MHTGPLEQVDGSILIVDDQPANLRLLSSVLKEQGYMVRTLTRGTVAIDSVQMNAPDLILLDVALPDMSGYQVCHQLKSDERTRHIPVIFLSALDDVMNKVSAFQVGGVDYITKPFQIEEVLARVATHMSLCSMQRQVAAQNAQLHQEIRDRQRAEHVLQQTYDELTRQTLERTAYDELTRLNSVLTRSRNLLRAMFDNLDDGLLLLDGNDIIQEINRPLAHLLDSKPEQMTGQSWHALYPVLAPGFPGELPANMLTSGRGMWRRRYQRADGTTHVLDFQSIVICGPDSNIEHIILRVADVTEHIRLQTLVLENERFAASGRLAASLAHEINTPLQALQSYLHLIQVAPETERSVFLTDAMQEMQRVGRIVHQLLDLYHPGNGEPEELDMNVMLERILLLLGKRMREQGVTVERHLADDLPPLLGHSDEVMHALLHVIVNALDAMPDGGVLGVHTAFHALEASLYITITDEGCGIAPEFQARIFEPFVTTKEDRNGLGLAISAQLARQYGGAINVKSHPGAGSTFTIVLPLPRKEPA